VLLTQCSARVLCTKSKRFMANKPLLGRGPIEMNKKLRLVRRTGRTQTRDAEQPIMGVALNQTRTALLSGKLGWRKAGAK